ncbi:hypothetical protein FHS16_003305 [Paenibacillus endophyticus]|uniref:Uncharacterized protein n=1 Tax=Paenibacillus endophyticus TaxID=1294268 RepID=A0A7W5C8T7_9BACL|nr:hypothetical protein [Paenibacillus endophyticus]MBB3153243.1 hypothetical protein [Paenibacillus endophyticus]
MEGVLVTNQKLKTNHQPPTNHQKPTNQSRRCTLHFVQCNRVKKAICQATLHNVQQKQSYERDKGLKSAFLLQKLQRSKGVVSYMTIRVYKVQRSKGGQMAGVLVTNHKPKTNNHQPTTKNQPTTNHQKPITKNQKPKKTKKPPTTNHQPPTTNQPTNQPITAMYIALCAM